MCEGKCAIYNFGPVQNQSIEKGGVGYEISVLSIELDPEGLNTEDQPGCVIDTSIEEARMAGSSIMENPKPCKLCSSQVNCIVFLASG